MNFTRETGTQKSEQFVKLQFLNDKIDQNTKFAKLPSAKYSDHSLKLDFQNCSTFLGLLLLWGEEVLENFCSNGTKYQKICSEPCFYC